MLDRFFKIKEDLKYCLSLQKSLNEKIDPEWTKNRTEEDFWRAIWVESAEAMESLPWK